MDAAVRVAKANAENRLHTMGSRVKSEKVKVCNCCDGDNDAGEQSAPPVMKFQATVTLPGVGGCYKAEGAMELEAEAEAAWGAFKILGLSNLKRIGRESFIAGGIIMKQFRFMCLSVTVCRGRAEVLLSFRR